MCKRYIQTNSSSQVIAKGTNVIAKKMLASIKLILSININQFVMHSSVFIALLLIQVLGQESCQEDLCSQDIGIIQDSIKSTLHIIPHSHQDVGWRKTVEGYFYGVNDDDIVGYSKRIYDSILKELLFDEKLTFTLGAEMAFFSKWYEQSSWANKEKMQKLIRTGRIELVNGGWVMCDSLVTYFDDILDQFTVGHHYLLKEFDYRPKVGWQIDPFGHSEIYAALVSELGLDSMFISRLPKPVKELRTASGQLEFIWHPRRKTQHDYSIFIHTTKDHYNNLPGTCFDWFYCFDKQVNNVPESDEQQLQDQFQKDLFASEAIQEKFQDYRQAYLGQNALHFFGDDFHFEFASRNFESLSNVFQMLEKTGKNTLNYTYSTPSRYLRRLNKENLQFPTYQGDFQPYIERATDYWTGFYTSRPNFKYHIFQYCRTLQAIRTLISSFIYKPNPMFNDTSNALQIFDHCNQVQAILMHHDAITGTSLEDVTKDYRRKIQIATSKLFDLYDKNFFQNTEVKSRTIRCDLESSNYDCPGLIDTLSSLGIDNQITLSLYNPGVKRLQIMRIPLPDTNFRVTSNQEDIQIKQEIICAKILNSYCILYFLDSLEGYSHSLYTITKIQQQNNAPVEEEPPYNPSDDLIQSESSSKCKTLSFDNQIVTIKCLGVNYPQEEFKFKLTYFNYSPKEVRKGGAYIFHPTEAPEDYFKVESFKIYDGSLVKQLVLTDNKMRVIVQLFPDLFQKDASINFEIITELLPRVDDFSQFEIVLRLLVLDSEVSASFFHDQNGLEFQSRDTSSYNLNVTQNYYPITTGIGTQITQKASKGFLYIMTDRAQGGTVFVDGQYEIMLNRGFGQDDGYGLGQNLKESVGGQIVPVTTRHKVIYDFSPSDDDPSSKIHNIFRFHQVCRDKAPIGTFINEAISRSGLEYPSPISISDSPFVNWQIYPLSLNQFILRITNMNEETVETVSLSDKFKGYKWTRTTLSGNQKYNQLSKNKLKWKQFDSFTYKKPKIETDNALILKIGPLQTKAFKFTRL